MLKGIEQNQQVMIFDDGLQDRNICYDIEFVCFDSDNFVGNGCLIPSGPLRENLNSLKKYDAVFLKNENKIIQEQIDLIKRHNQNIKIFETFFKITNLDKFNLNNKFIIFSGIGNPNNFKKILVNNKFKIIKEIIFADHYDYKKEEIENILTIAKEKDCKIITTEKDFVKIDKFGFTDINFIDVSLRVKDERKLIEFLQKKIYE